MLTNRAALWLMGLTIAVAALVGCVPHSLPGATATVQPTETISPTATATAADTPTLPPTKTEAPSLTPTPEGVDYSQAFFDPQSEADLPKVLQAPALDDPSRTQWEDGYLTAVNEKLKTYNDPTIDAGGIGTMFGINFFVFNSDVWPVVSSYKFVWNGQEMLTKTLVIKDSQGNKIPVSVTYTTSDSPVFDSDEGYKTPSSGVIRNLFVRYAWTDNLKNTVTDKFAEYFIPPNINITNLDALRRVFAGKGTAADRDLLSRSHLIWTRFDIN